METKVTLKVVQTRVECVITYSKIEKAILCSIPWTHVARGFLRVLRFAPILHRFNDSANKISSNKCDFSYVKLNS